jgi:hypothetical protein
MKFSHYRSEEGTGFGYQHGDKFLPSPINLIRPIRRINGSPSGCLLDRGRLISQLRSVCDESPNIMVGQMRSSTLIFMSSSNEKNFDVFLVDQPLADVSRKLLNGELNDDFYEIRNRSCRWQQAEL